MKTAALFVLIATTPVGARTPGDLDGDSVVGISDFLILPGNWT